MRIFYTILFISLAYLGYAQGYADNWVIKNGAGLNFSTGSPILFNTSAIDPIHPSNPAVACISDKNGNLLFYKSSTSLFSNNNTSIITGNQLYINSSSLNNNLDYILPSFHSDSLYFVFYSGNVDSLTILNYPEQHNIYYSVVDITANNGQGGVIVKNNALLSSSFLGSKIPSPQMLCSFNERLNRYEIYFWLLDQNNPQNNSNEPAHLIIIDSSGVQLTNQTFSSLKSQYYVWNNRASRLAAGIHVQNTSLKKISLISYNQSANTFQLDYSFIKSGLQDIRDMCFSPSGRFLYTTENTLNDNYEIYRYDLSLNNAIAVLNSAELVYQSSTHKITQIRQATNQKLYFLINNNSSSSIGELGYPDSTLFTGNFNPNAITPQGNHQFHSLPRFLPNWLAAPPFSLSYACQDSVVFDLTYKTMIDSVRWDFGDPASGAANTSTQLQPVHHYSSYGKYYVQVATWWQGMADTLADTVFVEPSPHVQLPNDTLLCAGESLNLDIGQGFAANYLWNTGSTDSTLHITQTGTYIATAYNHCGSQTDTLNVVVLDPPQAQLKDTSLCDNYNVILHFNADSATYLWNTGETSSTIYPTTTGTYSVDVQNPCGQVHDQAFVELKKCICNVYLANAFTPDGDGINDTFAPVADCPDFTYSLLIFDRWGNKIAELNENTPPWDGTANGQKLPIGVYTYQFHYQGTEYGRTVREMKNGTITIVK